MAEKRKRGQHFPLTIDTLGGVRLGSFSLQGEGGLSLTREVNGTNWRISSGEGSGRIDIQALEDNLTVSFLLPFMVLEYSRGSGSLKDILISGVDLAVLAGIKVALAKGDWGNVSDMKQLVNDRLLYLKFSSEGLQLAVIEASGREVVRTATENEENLGVEAVGFLPGKANYAWKGDLGFLKGRVGFEVFSDRVILFYEKEGAGERVRQEVMEVPRTVLETAKIDWAVTQGIPSEDDLLQFLEEVYQPRL